MCGGEQAWTGLGWGGGGASRNFVAVSIPGSFWIDVTTVRRDVIGRTVAMSLQNVVLSLNLSSLCYPFV
jgi:hypothetical protein